MDGITGTMRMDGPSRGNGSSGCGDGRACETCGVRRGCGMGWGVERGIGWGVERGMGCGMGWGIGWDRGWGTGRG